MEDFIGIYDDTLSIDHCNRFIEYFEYLKTLNHTYTRTELKDGHSHYKSDETAFLMDPFLMIKMDNPILAEFMDCFWEKYKSYADKFSVLHEAQRHGILSVRLQKTSPGQGYHKWHQESSSQETANRNIAFMIYLNDVPDGGETEFLYIHKRIKPKAGRLLIWPAGFTHTHRGNPPLEGVKYILTGWLEYYGRP